MKTTHDHTAFRIWYEIIKAYIRNTETSFNWNNNRQYIFRLEPKQVERVIVGIEYKARQSMSSKWEVVKGTDILDIHRISMWRWASNKNCVLSDNWGWDGGSIYIQVFHGSCPRAPTDPCTSIKVIHSPCRLHDEDHIICYWALVKGKWERLTIPACK